MQTNVFGPLMADLTNTDASSNVNCKWQAIRMNYYNWFSSGWMCTCIDTLVRLNLLDFIDLNNNNNVFNLYSAFSISYKRSRALIKLSIDTGKSGIESFTKQVGLNSVERNLWNWMSYILMIDLHFPQ